MNVVRFDIRSVEGYPFVASAEVREEYGAKVAHPILDRYFEAPAPVRWFYWRKFDILARLDASGGTALVAGCGPGVELPTLATGFDRVIALDINNDDLEVARAICRRTGVTNVEVLRADLMAAPVPPGSLDTVYMIDSLEHFQDATAPVAAVHAMLKEQGRFVVVAPTENRFNDWLRSAMGYKKPLSHYHTSQQLERVIRQRFTLVKKVRQLGLPRFISLAEIFLFVK